MVRSLPDGDEMAEALTLHSAPGAAGGIVASGTHLGRAFLLVTSDEPIRSIGPALIWSDRHGVSGVEILAEADVAPDLARRASLLRREDGEPAATVWSINGSPATGFELERAEPRPAAEVPTLNDDELAFRHTIEAAGARPVDDHGRLVGEIRGLEVARVTRFEADGSTARGDGGEAALEVGVGQADRELQQLVHGKLEREEALRRAIGMVMDHRRADRPLHPLNRLARERWLRAMVLDQPGSLDLVEAEPVPPLRPRSTLLGTVPSAASGKTASGQPVVVVCSVGIDVDLIPEAADYRQREAPDARLLIVLPAVDVHPAIGRQIALLDDASFVTIPSPWAADMTGS